MTLMLLTANALLYLSALALAIVMTRPPSGTAAARGARFARAMLACGGGLAIAAAIVLAFLGMWFASALAGAAAIVVVSVSMWFALAWMPAAADEKEDEDDDGGSLLRPASPEPTKPEGGPPDDFWAEFDAARSGWDREREPAGA